MAAHQHDENCKKMFALLSEYLDKELPVEACKEMDAHIAGCEPCKAFTESLRKTIDLCREHQPKELPGPIARDARQRLFEAYQKMHAGLRS
jgi:RNA polymerase sigma-70 factor (ECF subfamily)